MSNLPSRLTSPTDQQLRWVGGAYFSHYRQHSTESTNSSAFAEAIGQTTGPNLYSFDQSVIDQQSAEADAAKRKKLVWEVERRLIADDARPILFYTRAANCREPQVKGMITMVNSIYNSSRFEDVWLESEFGSSAHRQ